MSAEPELHYLCSHQGLEELVVSLRSGSKSCLKLVTVGVGIGRVFGYRCRPSRPIALSPFIGAGAIDPRTARRISPSPSLRCQSFNYGVRCSILGHLGSTGLNSSSTAQYRNLPHQKLCFGDRRTPYRGQISVLSIPRTFGRFFPVEARTPQHGLERYRILATHTS